MQRQHAAGEKSGEHHNREGTDADGIHLRDGVGNVARLGKKVADGSASSEYSWTEATNALRKAPGETRGMLCSGSEYQMQWLPARFGETCGAIISVARNGAEMRK